MIVCPNCGRENADNFNFCLDCGYDLKTYREAQGDGSGPEAPPPVGPANTPTSEPLGHGASTESLNADEVRELAQSASNPSQPAVTEAPAPAPAPTEAAQPAVAPAPTPAPAATPAPVPAPADTAPAQPMADAPACPSCATPNPVGMKFCGNCGSPMDGSARPAPAPAAPEPAAPGGGRTMFMHAADVGAQTRERTCKLVTIDQSGQEGMTYTLSSGQTACGRVNGIILFFDDPFVSPAHCTFAFEGDKLKVTDDDSLNGVYMRLHDERKLDEGDYLRIGRQLFRFEPLDAAKEQVTRAEGDDAKIWGSPNPGAFGRLVQVLEDGRTGEIRLLSGEACNLGREQGEIVFPTDGFISGRHCSFYMKAGETLVKDLGSSNGTYLRVRGQTTVGHGDFLLIGNQMLRVEIV